MSMTLPPHAALANTCSACSAAGVGGVIAMGVLHMFALALLASSPSIINALRTLVSSVRGGH